VRYGYRQSNRRPPYRQNMSDRRRNYQTDRRNMQQAHELNPQIREFQPRHIDERQRSEEVRMHTERSMVNNPNHENWKPNHWAIYVSSSVSLAQTDSSIKQTRKMSQSILIVIWKIKVKLWIVYRQERVGCDEHNVSEEKPSSECDIVYLHYVNEQNLGGCPQVKFLRGSRQYSAVLDTGCEALIL